MLKGRDILTYLAIKYNGNWDKIYESIVAKEKFTDNEFNKAIKSLNCNYITILDEEYPDQLKNCYKPPFVLFYKGNLNLLNKKVIAITCSKDMLGDTRNAIQDIIEGFNEDMVVATTITNESEIYIQKQAFINELPSIAVLNSSIGDYTDQARPFCENVEEKGLVLSEFTTPTHDKENVPFNARVLTELSQKLLVAQVEQRSYEMVVISHALSQNKDIYVIPQRVNNGTFNNHLIREGAALVETTQDLLLD